MRVSNSSMLRYHVKLHVYFDKFITLCRNVHSKHTTYYILQLSFLPFPLTNLHLIGREIILNDFLFFWFKSDRILANAVKSHPLIFLTRCEFSRGSVCRNRSWVSSRGRFAVFGPRVWVDELKQERAGIAVMCLDAAPLRWKTAGGDVQRWRSAVQLAVSPCERDGQISPVVRPLFYIPRPCCRSVCQGMIYELITSVQFLVIF